MAISTAIGIGLATALGKFLFKRFIGNTAKRFDETDSVAKIPASEGIWEAIGGATGEGIASGLADFVKDKLKDVSAERKASREFEDLGDRIVERLKKDLESQYAGIPEERWDRVLTWVNLALAGNITARFVIQNKVDSAKLFDALRGVPLNVPGPTTDEERTLFETALREVSRHIAAAASKLPKFDAENARASLDLLSSLRTDFDQVLDDVQFIREQVDKAHGTGVRDEYAVDYRQTIAREMNRVELFGVDLPDDLKRAKLTDAYVTLSIEYPDDSEDEEDVNEDEDEGHETLSTDVAFDTLLPKTGRLLVRGSAGSGKTTLMKWAAVQAARMMSSERDWRDRLEIADETEGPRIRTESEQVRMRVDWRQRMPFIVILRRCPDGVLPSPKDFPALVAKTLANTPTGWVESILKEGRGLVLLDGVDEIPHAHRSDLRDSVSQLVEAFPNSYFVLTTRPEAVDRGWLDDLGFCEVDVAPMSEEDRNGFIAVWFDAVSKGKGNPEIKDQASKLIDALPLAPWLSPLLTNPLLCAMTCALFYARDGFLPDGLRQMCETLTEMMLHRLDQERKIDLSKFPHPYPSLNYEQKKAVMRQLAYHFILNERSTLPVPTAVAQVALALSRIPDRAADEAESVFDGLLERSGMIREATSADDGTGEPATIEFLHNTFKEFLAGEQVASEGNSGFVLSHLDYEVWRRVGLFAFAAGNKTFQNDLLEPIS